MKLRTLFLILLLVGATTIGFANATHYARANGNWNANATWSDTSGGAAGTSFPVAGDVVYIGEVGSTTWTVTIPTGVSVGCTTLQLGASVNSAATLNINGNGSLAVSGNVTIYWPSNSNRTRAISIGAGSMSVGGNVTLAYLAPSSTGTKISKITLSSGTLTISGNLIYDSFGAAGDAEALVVFTGAGTMNLAGNLTINHTYGTLTPSTGTVKFNGSSAQTIAGNSAITYNNVTIDNSAGVALSSATISGVLTQNTGSMSGTYAFDGYSSPSEKYLSFPETGTNVSGFAISTTVAGANFPAKIEREWTITQTTGSLTKDITFYWDEADDNLFVWGSLVPAVWKGINKYTASSGNYDLASLPRYVTIIGMPITGTKDTYTIGRDDGGTLPIELSSFTVSPTSEYYVQLHWITQSETDVSGFYIFRNTTNDLSTAIVVSPLIGATNTSSETEYSYTDMEVAPNTTYYYWLQNVDLNGNYVFHGPVNVTVVHSGQIIEPPVIPVETMLKSIYPNPFNSMTSISYELTKGGNVSLEVYNIKGAKVRSLLSETKGIGSWRKTWDGNDENGKACSSGIYYVKMTTGKIVDTRKVVLVK